MIGLLNKFWFKEINDLTTLKPSTGRPEKIARFRPQLD